MSSSGAEADQSSARPTGPKLPVERIGGMVWVLFGAVVFYASWTMDRLESQGVAPITAPGLLPGLLGLGMIGFGLVLLLRRGAGPHGEAHGHFGIQAETAAPPEPGLDWRRLGLSWLLSVAFAGVFLGRGLPFWLLAAVFMFLHLVLLEDDDRRAARPLARRLAFAALVAGGTAAAVTLIFQELFLIRLP